jgi:predicted hydrocarbon binding protein
MTTPATSPFATDASRTVAMPIAFFAGLHASATERGGDATDAVRDAGYAAGQALLDSFGSWLRENGDVEPEALSDERFPALLQRFFEANGWGDVTLTALSDAVLMLDAWDWSEARVSANGCPVSTGVFAGFLGKLAGAPLSVLEVDPGTAEPGRCRFLIGSIDVLAYVWQAMQSGVPYADAAQRA